MLHKIERILHHNYGLLDSYKMAHSNLTTHMWADTQTKNKKMTCSFKHWSITHNSICQCITILSWVLEFLLKCSPWINSIVKSISEREVKIELPKNDMIISICIIKIALSAPVWVKFKVNYSIGKKKSYCQKDMD